MHLWERAGRLRRPLLAFGALLASVLVVAACANSSSTNANPDSGLGSDGTTPTESGVRDSSADTPNFGMDASDSSSCTAAQLCDGGCTDLQHDPKNCGTCGHACPTSTPMCSAGQCVFQCNPPEQQCGGPDAGPPPPSDAGPDVDAGGGGGSDAGGMPYCANLSNDPNNCGACGKTCGPNHICSTGQCTLNCPSNTLPCTQGDICYNKSMGQCCTAADCTGGASCPIPGGQCGCGAGQKYCATTSSCIPSGACCTNADCASLGEQCLMPGGSCGCPVGEKACPAAMGCIGGTSCCTSSDCSMIMGESCPMPGGQCTCSPGYRVCTQGNVCISSNPGICCTTADCMPPLTCSGFGGTCGCPAGERLCTANNTCIPNNPSVCCSNSDCPMGSGEVCSAPGGSCICPAGFTLCGTVCIANGTCCPGVPCSVAGETCPAPGGQCACPAGQFACSANNACIADLVRCPSPATCCTAADCTDTANVVATSCSGAGGTCGIVACAGGWVDVDGQYCDGCECQDDSNPIACAQASTLGSLGIGANTSVTGKLPKAGEEKWFFVTFTGNTNPSFHPNIFFSANPDGDVVFDLLNGGCGGGAPLCGSEGNAPCTAKTDWESFYQAGFNCLQFPRTPPCQYINNVGVMYIRVYRPSGAPTCNSFTLTISN